MPIAMVTMLLLGIEQVGGIACHTGQESCFFLELRGDRWVPADLFEEIPRIFTQNEY